MKIERFEDIGAWKKARGLVKKIYSITNYLKFSKDYSLKDQIRRASVSIMSNIAEGFGKKSDKEFAHSLNISHGSSAEVQSLLYISLDLNYILENEFKKLYSEVDEISKMIKGFMKYLR